jgi:hypothetical protein
VVGAVIMSWLSVKGLGQVPALLLTAFGIVAISICAEQVERPVRWLTGQLLKIVDPLLKKLLPSLYRITAASRA